MSDDGTTETGTMDKGWDGKHENSKNEHVDRTCSASRALRQWNCTHWRMQRWELAEHGQSVATSQPTIAQCQQTATGTRDTGSHSIRDSKTPAPLANLPFFDTILL